MDSTPSTTSSRISNFFSKGFKSNLKRTKSATKLSLERKKFNSSAESDVGKFSLKRSMSLGRLSRKTRQKTQENTIHETPVKTHESPQTNLQLINNKLRSSRSHESLLTSPNSMHSVDLTSPDVEIKPLHSSILGQDHCFQVSTNNGSKYFSCRTAEEREKWIECLRKTVHPDQEQSRRTDNSLKMWVLEAKNIPSKKRYFCEILLDKTLYARTSSKTKGDMLFWGESFDFNNLPAIDAITVNLYREADKKKKKDKNQLIGYININVSEITNRTFTEKWHPCSSAVVGKAGRESKAELPLMRVKARYQTVHILPMELYQDLSNYLLEEYIGLTEVLEPTVSVKSKEDIATALVHIMQKSNRAKDFLADVVMREVGRQDNENLTFRGNSIASKAMEAYMKLVGEKYLQDTLGHFITTLTESPDDCEVDPTKVGNNGTLQRHQTNLTMYCEMAWFKIINSYCYFPNELREVFSRFRIRCEELKREDTSDNLISSSIFLRFLCPAILSPSLFGLTQEYPSEKAARNLTLIAKTTQTLANFTKFGAKEEYMNFMNEFVEREWTSMKNFLKQISTSENNAKFTEFDGYIDLGKELSILHSLLLESMEKLSESAILKLGKLPKILSNLSEAQANPSVTKRKPINTQIYDNLPQLDCALNLLTKTEEDMINILQDYDEGGSRSVSLSHDDTSSQSQNASLDNSSDIIHNYGMGSLSKRSGRDFSEDYGKFPSLDESSVDFSVGSASNEVTPTSDDTDARLDVRSTAPRVEEVHKSWKDMVSAAELVNGDYVDLINFMDDIHSMDDIQEEMQNSSMEIEQNLKGSQGSISQLSGIASSGYQSFGYSQSSSPVEPIAQDGPKSPCTSTPGQLTQPLQFANPLFRLQANNSMSRSQSGGTKGVITVQSTGHSNGASSNLKTSSPKTEKNAGLKNMSSSSESLSSPRSTNSRTSSHGSVGSPCTNTVTSTRTFTLQGPTSGSTNGTFTPLSPTHRGCTTPQSPIHRSSSSSSYTTPPSPSSRTNSTSFTSQSPTPKDFFTPQSPTQKEFFPSPSPTPKDNNLPTRSSSRQADISETLFDSNGLPRFDNSLKASELSRSADFSHFRRQRSIERIRRTATDSAISQARIKLQTPPVPLRTSTPPDSPHYATYGPSRRGSAPVRMGVSSVQRKIKEKEKTNIEYEQEITTLKKQLDSTHSQIQETKKFYAEKELELNNRWQHKLNDTLAEMSKKQEEKDREMKSLIQRLVTVEENLKKEQTELRSVVSQKQRTLEIQEKRIQTLDATNQRLLTALNQLKDRYQLHSKNGLSSPLKTQLSITENGEYKSSSC
ncbi:unnamed protein product [Owenia fusiformis]|uniref:Uncharacterized protein n=1 Tax=Owenia fusiformis TaxID=6347 RepID=A0A8S4NYK9_OWEFU|nr:unnamed protein product [Owenia fusiformis]